MTNYLIFLACLLCLLVGIALGREQGYLAGYRQARTEQRDRKP